MRDGQRHVEEHVAVHVGQPAGLAHERIAVQEHPARGAKPLNQGLEQTGPGRRQEQVRVAEARVDLHGQRIAGRLVGLERGQEHVAERRPFESVGADGRRQRIEVEPAPVSGDRLEGDVATGPRARDRLAQAIERLDADLLGHLLDPHHRPRLAARQRGELARARAVLNRWKALVEQQQLGVGRSKQRRSVVVRIGSQAMRVDRLLVRLAAQMRGEHADRPPIHNTGGHVRPLARIGALGEQAPELVKAARRRAQDAVRVMVDRGGLRQYFSK